jgi:hypothetical protein
MATAPQQAANPYDDPQTAAVYDQMRQTVSPKEFGDEVLAGASQVDPQAVAQFRDDLSQINLPPEALDLLNNMVDEILASPQQYDQIRAKYLEMGAPEELLPEQFDPGFFAAMNMAVDQMVGAPAGEQAFAKGGIAELTPVSKAISSYGRNGDTMLAHITPAEARMLRRKGGSGSINPKTGLPEFFNLFKSIGNAFKAVGNAVKSFASSTVGKIVTTVALGFFLGPAAASFMGVTSAAGVAAVSGFVGSAGATLAGGGNLSQALKAGAIGGLTAGATAGVTGTNAFQSGSYSGAGLTPTEALQGQVDKFSNMVNPAAAAPTVPATAPPTITPTGQTTGLAPVQPPVGADFGNQLNMANPDYAPVNNAGAGAPGTSMMSSNPAQQFDTASLPSAPAGSVAPPANVGAPAGDKSWMDSAKDFYNKNISPSGIQEAGAEDALAKVQKQFPTATMEDIMKAPSGSPLAKAYSAASPGILSTYGPMTALGIGALGATGGFSPRPAATSALKTKLTGGPGSAADLLKNNPYQYYIQNLPGVQYYGGSVLPPTPMAAGGEVTGQGNIDLHIPVNIGGGSMNSTGQPGMPMQDVGTFPGYDVQQPLVQPAINYGLDDSNMGNPSNIQAPTEKMDFANNSAAQMNMVNNLRSSGGIGVFADGGEVRHFVKGGITDEQIAKWWSDPENQGKSDADIKTIMEQFDIKPTDFSRAIGANEETAKGIQEKYDAVPSLPADVVESVGDAGPVYINTKTGATSNNSPTEVVTDTNAVVTPPATTVAPPAVVGAPARSAADQALFDLFTTHQKDWTLGQFKTELDKLGYTPEDVSRVTGTPLEEVKKQYTIATSTPATPYTGYTPPATGGTTTVTPPGTVAPPTTVTPVTPPTTVGAPVTPVGGVAPVTPTGGNVASTKGITVASPTLRGTVAPTDDLSKKIQSAFVGFGTNPSEADMQKYMDKEKLDPRQVAIGLNIGLPEVQARYYNAKNAAILGAPAVTPVVPQVYNNTAGITQLLPKGQTFGQVPTSAAPAAPAGGLASLMPAAATPGSQNLPDLPQNTTATADLTAAAARARKDYLFAMNDKNAAFMNMGGIAGLAQGGYPRKTGQIQGPGTATSDSIPAMLSDGEFVMTAKAVRGAGKGDRRAGAKRMYALMNQLEKNAARG